MQHRAELQAPLTSGSKTPGERFYDTANFAISNICIAAATAAIAYTAAHGKDKYGILPNYLKQIMQPINRLRGPWAQKAEETAKALRSQTASVTKWDSQKADFKAIFGGSLTGAVILWWGGTAFAPIMKTMENNREAIANLYNKRFGSEQDVEQAHENLKDAPKQNWSDVLKGRMMAFVFAFSAFSSTCFLLGRTNHPTNKGNFPLRFDWYEEKIGRLVAGLGKDSQDIASTPMHIELSEAQKRAPLHRLGKILALDVYATALGVIVWNFFSRDSALKRQNAQREDLLATTTITSEAAINREHSKPEPKTHKPRTQVQQTQLDSLVNTSSTAAYVTP